MRELAVNGGEWWRGCGNTLSKKSLSLNLLLVITSSSWQTALMVWASAHCHYPLFAPGAGKFSSEFLSCLVITENQSEVEDIAPWKKNQICIKSLFFSLAVALALCLNSQKVSFLICQIIIKSTFYPVGFLNEVLRNVVNKNTSKTVKYFLMTY